MTCVPERGKPPPQGSHGSPRRTAALVIPYLGLDALIASKETYREQDVADRLRLLELKRRGY